MKKPKKPKKPKKTEPPPSKTVTRAVKVHKNRDGEYKLVENREEAVLAFWQQSCPHIEVEVEVVEDAWCGAELTVVSGAADAHDLYDNFYDEWEEVNLPISVKEIQKIEQLLPTGATNVKFYQDVDRDAYHCGIIFRFDLPLPQEEYEPLYSAWENRFQKYEEDLAQYEKELSVYEEFRKKEKIKKLQKEIKSLR